MSLGFIVKRLNVGFVLLVMLSSAGIFTLIFVIALIGMAGGRCANGSSNAAGYFTNILVI
jgi:hypothetical protein